MKPSYDFHQFGPFVIPDTGAGRRIIRRALRKGFGRWDEPCRFAGNATPEAVPGYAGRICSQVWKTDDIFQFDPNWWDRVPVSRVRVLTATCNSREYTWDAARLAETEWHECYKAAQNPAWTFSKEDKQNIDTMRSAIKRERENEWRDEAIKKRVLFNLKWSPPQSVRTKRSQLLALGIIA